MLYNETEFQKIFLQNLNIKDSYISSLVCKSWNNIIKINLDNEFIKYILDKIETIITHRVLIKTNTYVIPFYLDISYDMISNNNSLIKIINFIPSYKKYIVKNNLINVYKKYIDEGLKSIDGEKFLYDYIVYYYLKILNEHFDMNITYFKDNELKIYNEFLLQEEQDDNDIHYLYNNEEEFDDFDY